MASPLRSDREINEDEETKSLLSQSDSTMTTGLKSACSEFTALGLTWCFIVGLYLPVFNSSDSNNFSVASKQRCLVDTWKHATKSLLDYKTRLV